MTRVLMPRNHPNRLDPGLAVGLDREVLELAVLLGNHRQRAACSVNIHPAVSFHRSKRLRRTPCLLSLVVVDRPTRECPICSGGRTLRALEDFRRGSQTPWPYDAYPIECPNIVSWRCRSVRNAGMRCPIRPGAVPNVELQLRPEKSEKGRKFRGRA